MRIVRKIGCSFVILLSFLTLIYLGGCYYFNTRFLPNTWYGETYVTGYTMDDFLELVMQEEVTVPTLVVRFRDGIEQIDLDTCNWTRSYTNDLKQIAVGHSKWNWPTAIFSPTDIHVEPQYSYDKGLLEEQWKNLNCIQKEEFTSGICILYSKEDGFTLSDMDSEKIVSEEAFRYVCSQLDEKHYYVVISDEFYREVAFSASDLEVLQEWESLEHYLSRQVTFHMGAEDIVMDHDALEALLAVKDNLPVKYGNSLYQINETAFQNYITQTFGAYNTQNSVCNFHATRGDMVEIPYVTYGTEIDLEDLQKAVLTFLEDPEGNDLEYTPIYKKEGYTKGLNDIGNTYIEIDMTNQKLFYYVDGELNLQTDIVTGNEKKKMATPVGVYYIYFMQHNRVLHGGDVPTFVNDWMAVYKGVGIHDAYWRKEFGGDIYLENGSHGCINIPLEAANTLYDRVEVGIPVLTFY